MQQKYGPPHNDSGSSAYHAQTIVFCSITCMLCQDAKTTPVLFDRQAETVVKDCDLQVLA